MDVCRFTCSYFKDFTSKEIVLAFDYLAAGVIELKKDQGHYGTLSLEYWGSVLKAFRVHRVEETRKESIALGSLDQNHMRIKTPEEIKELNDKAMRSGVLESWKHFKETNVMPYSIDSDIVTVHYYDWLRAKGIIEQPTEEITAAIRAEAKEYQKEFAENKKAKPSLSEKRQMEQGIKRTQVISESTKIQSLSKKIAVRVFFEELLMEEKDLEELI